MKLFLLICLVGSIASTEVTDSPQVPTSNLAGDHPTKRVGQNVVLSPPTRLKPGEPPVPSLPTGLDPIKEIGYRSVRSPASHKPGDPLVSLGFFDEVYNSTAPVQIGY